MPKTGKLVSSRGSTAQWIAQASDVEIPKASQLTFTAIAGANIGTCNFVAKEMKCRL